MSTNEPPPADAESTPNPEMEAIKLKVTGLEKFLNNDDLKTLVESEKSKKTQTAKKEKETEKELNADNYKSLFDKVEKLEKGYSTIIEDGKKSTLVKLQTEILEIRPKFKDDPDFKNASEDTLKLLLKTVKEIQKANPQIHYNDNDDPENTEEQPEIFFDRRKVKANPEQYK